MVYSKREITDKQIDRDYLYQVELVVPEGGFGDQIRHMKVCAAIWGGKYRSESRLPLFYSCWCFKDAQSANWFKNTFGGVFIDLTNEREKDAKDSEEDATK